MVNVLHYGLSTNKGGIETYLKKLWDNIDHESFRFSFLDMTGEGNVPCFYEEFRQDGCVFYKITPRNVSVRKNREELELLFRTRHFDILHFHVNTLSYIAPVLVALKHGCRVIVHSRSAGSSKRLITRLLHYCNRTRLKNANVTRIGVSKMAADWLFGRHAQSEIYNNGIEITKFTFSQTDRHSVRSEYASEHALVVGNVGAFLPAKNHRFIIDVFSLVCKGQENAVLWLVGKGPDQSAIEQYVYQKGLCDKVRFLGACENMPRIYAGMDVFLFPSLFEGFPNAMLEAQCEGLPCLQSSCITKEVLLAENAFDFSLADTAAAWAEELLRVAKKQYPDRTLGALRIKNAGFSVEQEILRVEQLYEEVISS